MKLFDETENKYYELIARLLQNKQTYSKKDVENLVEENLLGKPDLNVMDTIFAGNEGEELIFLMENGRYKPILEQDFPIRAGTLEKEAVSSLLDNGYVGHFLSEETIEKLKSSTKDMVCEWTPKDIVVKNVFADGAAEQNIKYGPVISLLAKAIKGRRAIRYDNISKEKNFEYRNQYVYPVRIEFSIKNDRFRVNAYEPNQHRFIKMNLDTMENISLTEEVCDDDLEAKYKEFLKANTKTVKIDVEPVNHVIERCFRVFSYYDRRARYDKEENKYRLEISYLKFDESEIIKDILSLGSYVTVIEPPQLQDEVYRRILAASKLYEDN